MSVTKWITKLQRLSLLVLRDRIRPQHFHELLEFFDNAVALRQSRSRSYPSAQRNIDVMPRSRFWSLRFDSIWPHAGLCKCLGTSPEQIIYLGSVSGSSFKIGKCRHQSMAEVIAAQLQTARTTQPKQDNQ